MGEGRTVVVPGSVLWHDEVGSTSATTTTTTATSSTTGTTTTSTMTTTPSPGQGLLAEVFYFDQGRSLPDLSDREPAMVRVDQHVNYESTHGNWPGFTQSDNFAVRWTGQLAIASPGEYEFFTSSDDGSRATIDGTEVVDNDGLHEMVTKFGKMTLSAGRHEVLLEFFEKGGGAGMVFQYQGPDTEGLTVAVPTHVLWHRENREDMSQTAVDATVQMPDAGRRLRIPAKNNSVESSQAMSNHRYIVV